MCDKEVKNKTHLRNHKRTHLRDYKRIHDEQLKCEFCDFITLENQYLKAHMQRKHKTNMGNQNESNSMYSLSPSSHIKSFYCVFCRDMTSLKVGDSDQFQDHMESVHKIYYEFDILMSINFIDKVEKGEIIEKVKLRLIEEGQGKRNSKLTFSEISSQEKIIPKLEPVSNKCSTQQEEVITKEELICNNKQIYPPGVNPKYDKTEVIILKNEIVQISLYQENFNPIDKEFVCVGCKKKFHEKIPMLLHQKRNHECSAYNLLTDLNE